MIDVSAAVDFVRENGTALDNARLDNISGGNFDRGSVLDGFASVQNPDGGFPHADRRGFPSSVSNTASALRLLLELGLGRSGVARRAVDFLADMRKENSWPENPMIAPLDPPDWDMPGDERTTVWLTADVADVLLRLELGGMDLEPVGDFLAGYQAPDGRFMGYVQATWLALAVFCPWGLDRPRIFSDALAYLESSGGADRDAASMAWCLDCLKRAGVTVESPLVRRLLARLEGTQEEDGSWPVEGGEHLRPGTAVSVLLALEDLFQGGTRADKNQ